MKPICRNLRHIRADEFARVAIAVKFGCYRLATFLCLISCPEPPQADQLVLIRPADKNTLFAATDAIAIGMGAIIDVRPPGI